MSKPDQDNSRQKHARPACMPSNKEDGGFLPPINFRGTPSSDSDCDCRRTGPLSSNENSSLSSSPVKLPSIGRSFSTSVSSLNNSQSRDREKREILCRSPSCPSNIGLATDRPDKRDSRQTKHQPVTEDDDVRLPSIFKDRKSSNASYVTPRQASKNRSNSQSRQPVKPRDDSPKGTSTDKLKPGIRSDPVATPRDESSQDTYRSTTQCALLLPLRNSETRKSKRKRKNGHFRQNTQLSIKSDSAVCDEVSKDVIIPSTRSEYNGHSPVRELDSRILSESDDLNSDLSSEGNPVHPTYHVTKHSNKHQIRMKDLTHVKA